MSHSESRSGPCFLASEPMSQALLELSFFLYPRYPAFPHFCSQAANQLLSSVLVLSLELLVYDHMASPGDLQGVPGHFTGQGPPSQLRERGTVPTQMLKFVLQLGNMPMATGERVKARSHLSPRPGSPRTCCCQRSPLGISPVGKGGKR